MKYLCNSFSLNMLDRGESILLSVIPLSLEQAKDYGTNTHSVVGHEDTARVLSTILGYEVKYNRETVTMKFGDNAIVAQYSGTRLPEGATALPEGGKIEFWLVRV